MLVARQPLTPNDLKEATVAVPGRWTTAHLALRLAMPQVNVRFLPFDQVLERVADGSEVAGLLIHEGQLTYRDQGLHKVLDLGEWWRDETGLPLPLGGNAVRRDLGPETMREVARLLKASVAWGLAHRDEALAHAQRYGRGLDAARLDRFVGMYVNSWTEGLGERGRAAVKELLERGAASGLVPKASLDWVMA